MHFMSSDKSVAHRLFVWLAVIASLMQLSSNYNITFALALILFCSIDEMATFLESKSHTDVVA